MLRIHLAANIHCFVWISLTRALTARETWFREVRGGGFARCDAGDGARQLKGLDRDAESVGVRRQEVVFGTVFRRSRVGKPEIRSQENRATAESKPPLYLPVSGSWLLTSDFMILMVPSPTVRAKVGPPAPARDFAERGVEVVRSRGASSV